MSNGTENTIRIIACRVFRSALEYLKPENRYPNLRLTYLPSNLHLRPEKLAKYLRKEITLARRRNERIICLYGDCFPGISDYCHRRRVVKVPGPNCWEILLGSERFEQLIEETAGTYFLEKDLILNFEENCIEPLELYDEEMRNYCFGNYQKLLYVRQPSDPDLMPQANRLAEFLELSLEIMDADYSHLERRLTELI